MYKCTENLETFLNSVKTEYSEQYTEHHAKSQEGIICSVARFQFNYFQCQSTCCYRKEKLYFLEVGAKLRKEKDRGKTKESSIKSAKRKHWNL